MGVKASPLPCPRACVDPSSLRHPHVIPRSTSVVPRMRGPIPLAPPTCHPAPPSVVPAHAWTHPPCAIHMSSHTLTSVVPAHAWTHPPCATHMSSRAPPPLFPRMRGPIPLVPPTCHPAPPPCPRACVDPSPLRHPHVIPRPHLRFSRTEPAPVQTEAGTHPFPRSPSGIIWADPAKTHRRLVPCATTL